MAEAAWKRQLIFDGPEKKQGVSLRSPPTNVPFDPFEEIFTDLDSVVSGIDSDVETKPLGSIPKKRPLDEKIPCQAEEGI